MFPLVLLAASMSFASISVQGDESGMPGASNIYAPKFRIKNNDSKPTEGFKIYAYFMSENDIPDGDLELDNKKYPRARLDPTLKGNIRRVIVDYSDYSIPAGAYFPVPANPDELTTIFEIKRKSGTSVFSYPWRRGMKDIVIEFAGVEVYNRHPDFKSRVGVFVRNFNDCASGYNPVVRLDVEDNNNLSKVVAGDVKPKGIGFLDNNYVTFNYCAVSAKNLPKTAYDYMVLKLDKNCPDGTYWVTRHHDAEDHNNKNTYWRYVWPSKIGRDADFEYCFVPKSSPTNTKFPFGAQYGVFANPPSSVNIPKIVRSKILIDDEDNDNENSWDYHGAGWLKSQIDEIMRDSCDKKNPTRKNTIYHVIKWGTDLSKSAEVEVAEFPISAEKSLVAAAPFAPAIKGLDRSAVSVELKSEGKVKVSIVNANGSVIANVAQESLQPGIHQIKWNSGMVPSGRYIVKVEQNGMVNARNVILK